MQLEKLVAHIDQVLGEELPVTGESLAEPERETLQRIVSGDSFQDYLQDQVCRQIIRDYLTNAVVLGYIPEADLESLGGELDSPQARAAMSLHMLMSAVEEAPELLAGGVPPQLEPLQPEGDPPPNIHLVRN